MTAAIAYATLDSPLGELLVASGPRGLIRISFPEEPHDDVLEELGGSGLGEVSTGALDRERAQLTEYFAGTRTDFDLQVDLSLIEGSAFTKRVLAATSRIPYGSTSTYGAVAAKAGAPHGGRAAGNALNANPVPFVVPCHRVILASGDLGGYAGHEDRKAWLLRHEGSFHEPTTKGTA